MYEYGEPAKVNKGDVQKGNGNNYEFIPLKEQLEKIGFVDQEIVAAEVNSYDSYKPESYNYTTESSASKGAAEAVDYRTGVPEKSVSPTVALTVSGLLVAFMTILAGMLDNHDLALMLVIIGVVFLLTALVSLFGSHLSKKVASSWLTAINGLTVGLGGGLVISIIIFFIQLQILQK